MLIVGEECAQYLVPREDHANTKTVDKLCHHREGKVDESESQLH